MKNILQLLEFEPRFFQIVVLSLNWLSYHGLPTKENRTLHLIKYGGTREESVYVRLQFRYCLKQKKFQGHWTKLWLNFGRVKFFWLSAEFIDFIQWLVLQTAVHTFVQQTVYCHTQSSTFFKTKFGSKFRLDTWHQGKSVGVHCHSKASKSYPFSSTTAFCVYNAISVPVCGCKRIIGQLEWCNFVFTPIHQNN